MASLIDRLIAEYPEFDFFQAVLLLEEFYGRAGDPRPLESGRIVFDADTKLSFPPNDIAGTEKQQDALRFILSFMGLLGASSPLPIYFAELAYKNPEEAAGLADFLSLFNRRMYALFYRAWKKYHFLHTLTSTRTDTFSRAISAMAGIVQSDEKDQPDGRLLAYAGLLAGRSRGSAGLERMIAGMFDGIPVTVRQWTARRTPLPDVPAVGRNCCLGKTAIAGDTVIDRAGSFRVIVGPLSLDTYKTFLPGSENIKALVALVRNYLVDPLAFDVEICLQSVDLIPVVLGETRAQLGTTASLGNSSMRAGVQSVVVEG